MSREASTLRSDPINGFDDLLQVFEGGGRPRDEFKIGVEVERLAVHADTGKALNYSGAKGIEAILKRMAKKFDWQPTMSGGNVIGLTKGDTAITLEPGGQVEISSRQYSSLTKTEEDYKCFENQLKESSKDLNICWLTLGIQPVSRLQDIEWVPKPRYEIMQNYYSKKEGIPFDMMILTASIQVNLDYLNEDDARKKVRVGAVLAPVVGAAFANSGFEVGKPNGYATRRLVIWHRTDPDRCGIPKFFVDGSFSFEKYANYAADIPMYFASRDGKYVDHTDVTFREFLKGKTKSGPAIRSDWHNHLTTLFPDVRLKDHLEFRTADSHESPMVLALIAFWTGLMHDPQALDEAHARLDHFSHEEILQANQDAAKLGLQAKMGSESLLTLAKEITEISEKGQGRLKTNESNYLVPLQNILDRGKSLAEEATETWDGDICAFLRCNQS